MTVEISEALATRIVDVLLREAKDMTTYGDDRDNILRERDGLREVARAIDAGEPVVRRP